MTAPPTTPSGHTEDFGPNVAVAVRLSLAVGQVMRSGHPWPPQVAALAAAHLACATENEWRGGGPPMSSQPWLGAAEAFITADGATIPSQGPLARWIEGGWAQLLSPELIRGQAADERAEVFAVGVIAFVLSTARWPFLPDRDGLPLIKVGEGSVVGEAAVALSGTTDNPAARPSTLVPGFPEPLERAILTALTKDPWVRYQRLADFRRDLVSAASSALPEHLESILLGCGGEPTALDREGGPGQGRGDDQAPYPPVVTGEAVSLPGAGSLERTERRPSHRVSPRRSTAGAGSPPRVASASQRPWVGVLLWGLVAVALIGLVVGVYAAAQGPEVVVDVEATANSERASTSGITISNDGGMIEAEGPTLPSGVSDEQVWPNDPGGFAERPRPKPRPAVVATTETGRATIKSNLRGAQVYVDGALVGRTPLNAVVMYVGEHDFEVRAGPASWSQRRTVVKDGLLNVDALLHASRVNLVSLGTSECTVDGKPVSTSGRRPLFVGVGQHSIRCVDLESPQGAEPVVDETFEAKAGSVHRFHPRAR